MTRDDEPETGLVACNIDEDRDIVTNRDRAAAGLVRRALLQSAVLLAPLFAFPAALLGRPRPAFADLSTQDMADVVRVEQYMDGIITLQAKFQQVDPDGKISRGKIYLRKPGRLRVEYDPPVPILVVADGGLLSYYDKELDQLNQVPLRQSPAWFLLRQPMDLSKGVTVSQIDRSQSGLQVHVFQTDEPDAGSVSLIFTDNPLELTHWTVTDANNQQVSTGLYDVQMGIDLPAELFATPTTQHQKEGGKHH
jgi:outer membrane lipoprotein-sorting protein